MSRINEPDSIQNDATESKSGKLNRIVLSILAPLLIIVGILGFVLPWQYTIFSNAAPYNLFHIALGALCLWLLNLKSELVAIGFNLGFGLFVLYQVIASFFGLTPVQYFLWTPADDFVHVILGVALVYVAVQGIKAQGLFSVRRMT